MVDLNHTPLIIQLTVPVHRCLGSKFRNNFARLVLRLSRLKMEQQSSNTAHPAVGRPSVGRLRSAHSMSTPPPPRPPRGVILDASAVAREPAKRKPAFGGTAGAKASHWRHSYTADREPSEGSQASAFDPSKAVLPTNRADKVFAYTMEGSK